MTVVVSDTFKPTRATTAVSHFTKMIRISTAENGDFISVEMKIYGLSGMTPLSLKIGMENLSIPTAIKQNNPHRDGNIERFLGSTHGNLNNRIA